MIARTLVIAAGALLVCGAAVEAGEFRVVRDGRIDRRMGFDRHRSPRSVWVPGRYETRLTRRWVPGHYRVESTPAEFQVFRDRHGRTHRIVIRPAGTRTVWVAGRYETRRTRVWIPGHHELRRGPTLRGSKHRGTARRH